MPPYFGPVRVEGPAAIYSNQVTVGTSAAALPSQTLTGGSVAFKADDDNPGIIYIGGSTVTTSSGYRLDPGQSVPVNVAELSTIYAIASQASQKLHILGS